MNDTDDVHAMDEEDLDTAVLENIKVLNLLDMQGIDIIKIPGKVPEEVSESMSETRHYQYTKQQRKKKSEMDKKVKEFKQQLEAVRVDKYKDVKKDINKNITKNIIIGWIKTVSEYFKNELYDFTVSKDYDFLLNNNVIVKCLIQFHFILGIDYLFDIWVFSDLGILLDFIIQPIFQYLNHYKSIILDAACDVGHVDKSSKNLTFTWYVLNQFLFKVRSKYLFLSKIMDLFVQNDYESLLCEFLFTEIEFSKYKTKEGESKSKQIICSPLAILRYCVLFRRDLTQQISESLAISYLIYIQNCLNLWEEKGNLIIIQDALYILSHIFLIEPNFILLQSMLSRLQFSTFDILISACRKNKFSEYVQNDALLFISQLLQCPQAVSFHRYLSYKSKFFKNLRHMLIQDKHLYIQENAFRVLSFMSVNSNHLDIFGPHLFELDIDLPGEKELLPLNSDVSISNLSPLLKVVYFSLYLKPEMHKKSGSKTRQIKHSTIIIHNSIQFVFQCVLHGQEKVLKLLVSSNILTLALDRAFSHHLQCQCEMLSINLLPVLEIILKYEYFKFNSYLQLSLISTLQSLQEIPRFQFRTKLLLDRYFLNTCIYNYD